MGNIKKLDNKEINKFIKKFQNEGLLKNYDIIWILEQTKKSSRWEVYTTTDGTGCLVKQNKFYWVYCEQGKDLEIFCREIAKNKNLYIHCYQNWVKNYFVEKIYDISCKERSYYYVTQENFKKGKIKDVINLEFNDSNLEEWYSKELKDFLLQKQKIYGIKQDDNLVAWTYVDTITKNIAEVYKIEVHPLSRRRGYGKQVLSAAVDDVLKREDMVVFNVSVENQAAIEMIKKLGFKEQGKEYRLAN
ncbi:GNAT family N-acetyltransferase [Proteinivorax tanatarense]|uniref:GNAT family N-acetyltransferase n=1 Tax=Proteinivorax tanatarense TaxID=1260629 RepID=A0AAU7VIM6_9FIRM